MFDERANPKTEMEWDWGRHSEGQRSTHHNDQEADSEQGYPLASCLYPFTPSGPPDHGMELLEFRDVDLLWKHSHRQRSVVCFTNLSGACQDSEAGSQHQPFHTKRMGNTARYKLTICVTPWEMPRSSLYCCYSFWVASRHFQYKKQQNQAKSKTKNKK